MLLDECGRTSKGFTRVKRSLDRGCRALHASATAVKRQDDWAMFCFWARSFTMDMVETAYLDTGQIHAPNSGEQSMIGKPTSLVLASLAVARESAHVVQYRCNMCDI